ncbi:MAG: LPS-assembly protein LptD, partial [Vicinamibacterales bacterium]
MPRFALRVCCVAAWLAWASTATAQSLSGYNSVSDSRERLSENHWKLTGGVELEQKDTKLYADEVEIFTDQDRAVATGNVVFTQGNNRIAAERAEFNTRTRLGTFYGASGIANVQPPVRATGAAMFAPPVSSQQTDVYFFGDVVEKIGAKKYRITNGGFSTCVQPTPRWDMHADTVVLNIDHYTLLRNAVLNVKGVPMFYLPVLYYPTKEEGRATGMLLPTYGASSLRGQAIHNAFFWAISRSQDATIMHDWYSKAGQGIGSEYRYNFGGGSDGTVSALLLQQKATTDPTGTTGTLPAAREYFIRGAANQILPGNLRARFQADYFSSVNVMQSFNTNVYDASRNQRSFGANVVGSWRT